MEVNVRTNPKSYMNKKIWCRLAQSVPKNSWKRLVQEARQKQQFFVWLRLALSGMVLSGTSGLGVTKAFSCGKNSGIKRGQKLGC